MARPAWPGNANNTARGTPTALSSNLLVALATIPLITAFIGYITNWAAVKMIFNPQHFVGVGPIGWQGVLPRKADVFANGVADTMSQRVLSARDLAERLDPEEMERLFEDRLAAAAPELVREAAEVLAPDLWDTMVPEARSAVVHQVVTMSRATARDVFDDLQGISDELLDLRQLVVGLLTGPNVARLVRLFREIGGPELRWIIRYGGIFGLMVGLVQAASYTALGQWWLLPIVGGIVGLGTNYLAIHMIFRPMEPRRFGPVKLQGLFPKRQEQIAADYGRIASGEILTPRNLLRLLTEGETGTRIARVVLQRVSTAIDAQAPTLAALTGAEVTQEQLDTIKWRLVERVARDYPDVRPELEDYLERTFDVGGQVESKLAALSKPEFERLLRGLFEQDEWILITIGGALGLGVGILQAAIVLAVG
jgi:uncharacterized membrane protein YheB (UPF0754 family)